MDSNCRQSRVTLGLTGGEGEWEGLDEVKFRMALLFGEPQ